MEFNRLISLVIGFIVFILIFVWVGSRFRSATKQSQNGVTVTATMTPSPTVAKSAESKSWNPFAFLFNRNSPTPTLTGTIQPKITVTPTISTVVIKNTQKPTKIIQPTIIVYKNNSTGQTTPIANSGLKKIPDTGASTMLIPIAFSALTLGAYIKKRV